MMGRRVERVSGLANVQSRVGWLGSEKQPRPSGSVSISQVLVFGSSGRPSRVIGSYRPRQVFRRYLWRRLTIPDWLPLLRGPRHMYLIFCMAFGYSSVPKIQMPEHTLCTLDFLPAHLDRFVQVQRSHLPRDSYLLRTLTRSSAWA